MQRASEVRPAVAVQGLFVLFGLVVAVFFPFFALYLNDRGLSKAEIGFVLAAMALARLVSNPVWGHVADTKIGRVVALRIGLLGTAIGALLLAAADGLLGIAIAAVAGSVFFVATGPNLDAIALVHLGDDQMHQYGRIRGWESLAYAAGCLGCGALFQAAGIRWAMPLFALAALAVLAWSLTIRRDRPAGGERLGRLGAVGAVFRAAPRFWGFLAAALLVWTGFHAAWNYFSLRVEDAGGGPLLVGIGTALGGLIEVPVMRSSGRLQLRFGLRTLYVAGCLVYGLNFLLWGVVSDPRLVSVVTVLEGVGFSLLFTSGVVVVGRLIPSGLYATANGIGVAVAFGIAPIIGAGLGGLIYERMGALVLYGGASALAVAGAVVAWFALDLPSLTRTGSVET